MTSNRIDKEVDKYWRIFGVNYCGKVCAIDLLGKLLNDKQFLTSPEWKNQVDYRMKSHLFYVGDAPLIHSLCKHLYNAKDDIYCQEDREKIRLFLQSMFNENMLITSSNVIWSFSKNKDVVVHQPFMKELKKKGNLLGELTDVVNMILLDEDGKKISEIYKWITGKEKFSLTAPSTRPKDPTFSAIGFSATKDFCYINLVNLDIPFAYPTLGFRYFKFGD